MGKLQNRVPFPELNRGVWEVMSNAEQSEWVDSAEEIIKERGLPHHQMTVSDRIRMFNDLHCLDSSTVLEKNEIRQVQTGSKLAWCFQPHTWSVKCGGKSSPEITFNHSLEKVIKKIFLLKKDFNIGNFRAMLKVYSNTQSVSNFRPSAAKVIYDRYAGKGVVWDMCCGYGGRLLGFMASRKGKVYYGTEPCTPTYQGLIALKNDFNQDYSKIIIPSAFVDAVPLTEKKIFLYQKCAEDFIPPEKIDLAFTSPPYFSTEKYSNEKTQSYMRYPKFNDWLDHFMGGVIDNVLQVLKSNGRLLLNVANTNEAPMLEQHIIKLAEGKGFKLVKTLEMRLSDTLGTRHTGKKHYEPIFVFKRK